MQTISLIKQQGTYETAALCRFSTDKILETSVPNNAHTYCHFSTNMADQTKREPFLNEDKVFYERNIKETLLSSEIT